MESPESSATRSVETEPARMRMRGRDTTVGDARLAYRKCVSRIWCVTMVKDGLATAR